jgi:hypothetical protein
LVAYEDLKTLACNGNIGAVNVNMSAGTAAASSGHTVVSYSNGTVILDSSIYPFCYNFDPNEYGGTTGIASMLPYVSFSQDLNRFVLTVTNLGTPSANVTWGSQTMNFTSAQLAAGVNLPAQFTSTPFDATFAQMMAAIVNKEYFEDYETKGTSNYFGNDNGGNVDSNMITYQAQLDAGVKALIVPVRHSIVIVPQGASTAVAPVITGTMMAYPTVGQSFSYQVSALNGPTSFTATGSFPSGLSMNSSGLITGTPTATGVSVVNLSATNNYGTSLSTHLTLTVLNPVPAAPGITSPLTATATVGSTFSYNITATGSPTNYFVVVPSNVGTEPPASSLPPGLSYNTYTGVFSGTPTTAGTYNVELAAVNAGGVSATSELNPLVLTINPASGGVPSAPTSLTAMAGSGQVSLGWGASAGATSYNVYRGTSAGGEGATPIATGITSVSYPDTSVTNGMTYYYKVAAVNTSGTSALSNEASAMPVGGLPAAPTGLTAMAGNAQVSLSWTASSGAMSYNVYRGTLPTQENTTPIATGVTLTSYLDTTVTNGPTFYYKVAAVNTSGTSSLSNEASATPTSGGGTTTYYQDSFSRTGDMTGSAPDVTDTGGATWSNSAGTGQYPIAGGTASINPAAYSWSAEYLPVNGTSGITLDGTRDFTLSVVVTSPASGRTGICLSTGVPGNLYSNAFAAMSTCSSFTGAYAFNGGAINYNFGAGISGATTISLAYSASAGTLTYKVGSLTLATETGVTPAQVATIRYVGLGDDGYGGGAAAPAPTFDNFTFTVASAANPATLTSAVSSQVQGTAGTFGLPLSLTGSPTIECRRGSTAGSYTIAMIFSQPVTSLTATLGLQAGQSGTVVGTAQTPSISGSTVTVNLTGVGDAQRLNLQLSNIQPGSGTASVPINILWGDVKGTGVVSSADYLATRSEEGALLNSTNFQYDINCDGIISSGDALLVRSLSGTFLP